MSVQCKSNRKCAGNFTDISVNDTIYNLMYNTFIILNYKIIFYKFL